jgi:hypothetical protein
MGCQKIHIVYRLKQTLNLLECQSGDNHHSPL